MIISTKRNDKKEEILFTWTRVQGKLEIDVLEDKRFRRQ